MRKNIYDKEGVTLIRTEEATPECGEHFCDTCGDCLHCYGYDPCYPDGTEGEARGHFWVQYGEGADR